MTNDQTWAQALEILSTQMTRATYEQWLKDTRLVSLVDNELTIAAGSSQAVDWLDHRLFNQVNRTVADLFGPVNLQFVVVDPAQAQLVELPAEPPAEAQPAESLGQAVARADYYAAHYGKGGAGYGMIAHYDNVFWAPFLGPAWPLWLRLANQKRATVRAVPDRWTDPGRYSYRELAGWLNLSHTRNISGYMWECWRSRQAILETGQPLAACCDQHNPTAQRLDREDRPRCVYWKSGLLERLHNAALVGIKEQKTTGGIRGHVLMIQTWRMLPVLTPAQAAQLNPDLQKLHDRWLVDFGHLLGLTGPDQWDQITQASLVPLMEGYKDHKKLTGPYRPAIRFQNLLRHGSCKNGINCDMGVA